MSALYLKSTRLFGFLLC